MSSGFKIFAAIALVAAVVAVPLLTSNSQHRPRTRRTGEGNASDNKTTLASSDSGKVFSDEDFVGSQACKKCHEDIYESYVHSPKGMSMATPADVKIRDEFVDTVISPPSKRRYRVDVDDDSMTHSEFRVDDEGEVIYEQEKPVAYILGSGRRGRAYLIHEGDMLFQSPLAWYPKDDRWGLAPGYDPKGHPRFAREASDGCLYCHAGRTDAHDQDVSRYHDPIFLEASIGCERCHGPGKDHVAFHSDSAADRSDSDPIVNPASLDPARRDAICYQCHLIGHSVVRKLGKSYFDFHPGQTLEETFVLLASDFRGISDVSQVEQMHASRCYLESEGQLGCTSCHSAHAPPAPDRREEFYRQRCLTCHQDQGCGLPEEQRRQEPANNSCIHCHMPKLPTDDDPHTTATHHGIPRTPDTKVKLPAPTSEGLSVFGDGEERLSRLDLDRAKGITLMMHAQISQNKELAEQALRYLFDAMLVSPDPLRERLRKLADPQLLQEMGTGYAMLGQQDLAKLCWQRLLELQPENKSALRGLGRLAIEDKDLEGLKSLLNRMGKLQPPPEEYLQMKMRYGFHSGEPEVVLEAGEALLERNPGLIAPRRILIEAYRQLGREDKAEEHRKFIDRM